MSQLHALPEVEDVVTVTGSSGLLNRLRGPGRLHLLRFLPEYI
jgi:hypothetical protein